MPEDSDAPVARAELPTRERQLDRTVRRMPLDLRPGFVVERHEKGDRRCCIRHQIRLWDGDLEARAGGVRRTAGPAGDPVRLDRLPIPEARGQPAAVLPD